MTLIRIGNIIVNFDNVITVIPGTEPRSLILRFINDQTQTFEGDEAEGLQIFLDKNVRSAVKPLDDFMIEKP